MDVGEIIEICMKFAPTVQATILNHNKNRRMAELDQEKLRTVRKLAIRDEPVGQEQPRGNSKTVEFPQGWKEGESVSKLGNRYWNGYHGIVDALPDDATEATVQKTMKKIETSMREFPCPSCRENVARILDATPMVTAEVTSKKDAQMALCRTHNSVSEHVGNPTVDCEATYGKQ